MSRSTLKLDSKPAFGLSSLWRLDRAPPSSGRCPTLETELCRGSRLGLPAYDALLAQNLTKGRPGGKHPFGKLAMRSPAFSLSAASRKAETKYP